MLARGNSCILAGLLAVLVAGPGRGARGDQPSGRPDVEVITLDAVEDGKAGSFHFLAVDDPLQPRYLFAADVDRHVIRRKDVRSGVWEVLAGQSGTPGAEDGPPGTALFNRPAAACVNPQGTLVVADSGNACLRLVSPKGMVTTLAGHCGSSGTRDGSGRDALFNTSLSSILCLANCSILVADAANGRLRQIAVHDRACAAVAAAAEARRFPAAALWLSGVVGAVCALAAASAAYYCMEAPLTAAGFVVWNSRRPGAQEGAWEEGYAPLVQAADPQLAAAAVPVPARTGPEL